jgi:hypothetical protein
LKNYIKNYIGGIMIKSIRRICHYIPDVEDYYFIANDGTFFRQIKYYDGWAYWDDKLKKRIRITQQVRSAIKEVKSKNQRFISINNRIYVTDDGYVLDKRNIKIEPGEYYQIDMITIAGDTLRKYLHQIVAICFMSGYYNGCVVHHKDGNTKNNDVTNLEIMSRKEHFIEHYNRGDISEPPHSVKYKRVIISDGNEDIVIDGSIKKFLETANFRSESFYDLLRGDIEEYKGYKVKSIEYDLGSETIENTEK